MFLSQSKFALLLCGLTLLLAVIKPADAEQKNSGPVYEMRVYHTNEGKLDDLLARFRDHTCELFTKHGMTNVAYFVPEGKDNKRLVYFMKYPSRAARDASWKGFLNDPQWKAAYKESIKNGRLIHRVDSTFLTLTDYSPAFPGKSHTPGRLFELRTYTATPGNLKLLHSRFRDHTVKLFAKHGITNIAYFNLMPDQKGAENTLIYLISHKDRQARQKSFSDFLKDPEWQNARKQSEIAGGGPLTTKGGVKHEFLLPTDFSPLK